MSTTKIISLIKITHLKIASVIYLNMFDNKVFKHFVKNKGNTIVILYLLLL